MNTMNQIMEQMKQNTKRIDELTEIVQNTPYSKRTEPEIVKAADEAEVLKVENKILHDNARRAYVAEVFPVALEIVNKYKGKPYGPKTKEKMQDELKARCNASFYLSQSEYDAGSIHLIPLNSQGYSGQSGFLYDDFDLFHENLTGNKLFTDNKINEQIAENFTLSHCGQYVENVHQRAEEIIAKWRTAKATYAALEKQLSEFNGIVPSQIKHRYANSMTTYSSVCVA